MTVGVKARVHLGDLLPVLHILRDVSNSDIDGYADSALEISITAQVDLT